KAGIKISLPPELKSSPLLSFLAKRGLLEIARQSDEDSVICNFTSNESARFIGTGDWLTIYVWHALVTAGFADDCQWGYRISNGQIQYEFDVVFTHKTRLFIVECSTAPNSFRRSDTLSRLDSHANMLGGSFVSRFFITSRSNSME